MTSDTAIIDEILRREGWPKFTNLPADRGGPTKGGITLETWRSLPGNELATAADLEQITEEQARSVYRQLYIIDPHFDQIDSNELRELVIDAGVNHGTRRAAKWLQAVLRLSQDGILGPITLAAVSCADPRGLFLLIIAKRARLYGRLVSSDKQLRMARDEGYELQAQFAAGWNNRIAEFIEQEAARQMHTVS